MILAFLILASGIAPQAAPTSSELLSENAVLGETHARLSIACVREKTVMRLRWPEDLASPVVLVGVGRARGQDAVMQTNMPWKKLGGSTRETVIESPDVAVLTDFQPDETLLLLAVESQSAAPAAEFSVTRLKAAYAKVADRCR